MAVPSERDNLRLLLQYSRKLSAFQNRANLVHKCLEEVLENGAFVLLLASSTGLVG